MIFLDTQQEYDEYREKYLERWTEVQSKVEDIAAMNKRGASIAEVSVSTELLQSEVAGLALMEEALVEYEDFNA